MKKLVIFNVGGALSSYLELDGVSIFIDLGSSSSFSPVENFLLPMARKRSFIQDSEDRFKIDQLFLSHLDKDHISDYEKFREYFNPDWMTCPNNNQREVGQDKSKQDGSFLVNVDLLGEDFSLRSLVLKDMQSRNPLSSNHPLGSKAKESVYLYFIRPKTCEENKVLKRGYANNISLVLFINSNGKTILMPGDLLKEGMEFLINNCVEFNTNLREIGVDYLIAPHHGLQTSFSEYLFQTIRGNKTRLNIISEKIRLQNISENRSDVDSRYYSSVYSTGDNLLNKNAVKTSMGHIIIDLESGGSEIKQVLNDQEVLDEFIN